MPVEITTRSLFCSDQRTEGSKYANDFPTPVPASKTPVEDLLKVAAIAFVKL